MAISGLDRRASKLEDSLEYLRNKREAEERQAWREDNSEKLRWEMFLRNHGPDSISWTEKDFEKYPDEKYDIEAGLACQEMLQKVLAKYKDDEADHTAMDRTEMAFAYLLKEFSWSIDTYSLFNEDIDYWLDKLKLDEIRPPFVELMMAIDGHIGSSDWREIHYRQENQDAMMERLFENYEDRRACYLKYKAEHPAETNL